MVSFRTTVLHVIVIRGLCHVYVMLMGLELTSVEIVRHIRVERQIFEHSYIGSDVVEHRIVVHIRIVELSGWSSNVCGN